MLPCATRWQPRSAALILQNKASCTVLNTKGYRLLLTWIHAPARAITHAAPPSTQRHGSQEVNLQHASNAHVQLNGCSVRYSWLHALTWTVTGRCTMRLCHLAHCPKTPRRQGA
jgi:hypothetical protein